MSQTMKSQVKISSDAKPEEEESLYDQFGGDERMSCLVDTWLKSFSHSEMIQEHNSKYADPAEREALKEKYVQYMKFLFGGSNEYMGRALADVHKNLGITDQQFDEANMKFVKTMQQARPRTKPKVFRAMVQKV